jgi:ATP-dependent DNA helicase RecG
MKATIFVSSVQKELAEERGALAEHVREDPLLRRFFDVFLFEELPAKDRRADEVYLDKIDEAAVYVGIFGNQYGFEDETGISPTQREFERATVRGIPRLIFVKGDNDEAREPKMAALVRGAAGQLIRRRFRSTPELLRLFQESLVEYLQGRGMIHSTVFEQRPCSDATLDDIDPDTVARFVLRARHERQFPLSAGSPARDVLTHLRLFDHAQPSVAAVLLFGRDPQRFVPAAEVRCMHFHGTEVQRPAPSYQIFRGDLFEQVDQGTDFVLAKLARTVGTRKLGPQAPVTYEIPPEVVREAIVNAVAHRDYASAAAIQVSVFADRVEVWNPGELPPELTPARLREPHASIARNARICEALFLARYIEKYGTGTIMMIHECSESGLPEPEFEQRGGEFVVTLWRDWLTKAVMNSLGLNDRQKKALAYVRANRRIGNIVYQHLTSAIKKTASRDLDDLVQRGVFRKVGKTGRGTYYTLAGKGDIKGTKGTSPERGHKGDKRDDTPSRKKRATNAPIAPAAQTETSSARAHKGATKGSKASQKAQWRTRRKPKKGRRK